MTALTIQNAAGQFLASRRIAVTGVSRTAQGHGSNVVAQRLRERGYEVYAVNPNAQELEGRPSYPNLRAVPGGVDAVVIGTRPGRALETMREAVDLGIRKVWMHRGPGAGSVSPEAATFGREHGVMVIDGGCPLMFGRASDGGHRLMCWFLTLTGQIPKTV